MKINVLKTPKENLSMAFANSIFIK